MNVPQLIQTLLVLALPTAVSLQPGHVQAVDCLESGTPTELTSAWREGNVLMLMRHTEKCSDSHPCKQDFGPTLRTWSTAWMLAPMIGHRTDDAWQDCDIDFLGTLETLKSRGRNLVVVTHSHCLNALKDRNDMPLLDFSAGDEAFFGLSLAFNASENRGFNPEPIACRLPESWLTQPGDSL